MGPRHTEGLPGTALDLAAGEGRNAIWLAERGWQLTAIDFSGVAIIKARELAARRGDHQGPGAGRPARRSGGRPEPLAVADVLSYRPAGAYDRVLVVYLHVAPEQRRAALRRAAAAVAPGARLLVVGHHADNLAHGVGGPPDPSVLYTKHDVLAT